MRRPWSTGLLALLIASSLAPALAAPKGDAPARPERKAVQWTSERYSLTARGPAGWEQVIDEPRADGRWIDLVAYREEQTKAYLKVSCCANAYRDFDDMCRKVGEHYQGLKDIQLIQGPETTPAVTGVRTEGLYFVYLRPRDKGADKGFLAYYLNGRYTVRVFGVAAEKQYPKVEPAFTAFLGSIRFLSRSVLSAKPNFVHEASKCGLIFPEGWTVTVPERGPVAAFVGERLGVTIWLYREEWTRGLAAYGKNRREVLERSGAVSIAGGEPSVDPDRGEPVFVVEYDQGAGDKVRHFREVCLEHDGAVYRLALGASPKAFPDGLPALEKMVETLRYR